LVENRIILLSFKKEKIAFRKIPKEQKITIAAVKEKDAEQIEFLLIVDLQKKKTGTVCNDLKEVSGGTLFLFDK
jgi:hypothetical protein